MRRVDEAVHERMPRTDCLPQSPVEFRRMFPGFEHGGSAPDHFFPLPSRHPFHRRVPFEQAAFRVGQHDPVLHQLEQPVVELQLGLLPAPPLQDRGDGVRHGTQKLQLLVREFPDALAMGAHDAVHAILDHHRGAHAGNPPVLRQKPGRREAGFVAEVADDDRTALPDRIAGLGMSTAFDREASDQPFAPTDSRHEIEMLIGLPRDQNLAQLDVEGFGGQPDRLVHDFLDRHSADRQCADPGEHRLESGDLRGFVREQRSSGDVLKHQQDARAAVIGNDVEAAFVDELPALAVGQTILGDPPGAERLVVPGGRFGEQARAKRGRGGALRSRLVRLSVSRGGSLDEFSEPRVLVDEDALGDEAEAALDAVADPGQHFGGGDFRLCQERRFRTKASGR